MDEFERIDHYTKLFFGRPLSPRQVRRVNKKNNKNKKNNYIKESLT